MKNSVLPRPPPIPASPHLKQSQVLKMVQEEMGHPGKGQQQWPPVRSIPGAPRPHDFLANVEGKKIAWPPHLSSREDLSGDTEANLDQPHDASRVPQNAGGSREGRTFPADLSIPSARFKLREEAPTDHSEGVQVFPAQPAFKITQPMKVKGDEKWPPRRGNEDITQEQVREFLKPKKTHRDYTEFFAQNALPNTYPAYRAPPGTQHHAADE